MTKEEFNKKTDEEFTLKEQMLINPVIYWNEKYINYWIDYNSEKYKKCFNFLVKNRTLLKVENVPTKFKEYIKMLNIK